MRVSDVHLAGIKVIDPQVFGDPRGFFLESYHLPRYAAAGIAAVFVQDNLSLSVRHTLRGLHYQIRHPQAKLIQVLRGEVFDVAVDLRKDSPTFGSWAGFYLSDVNHRQVFIPEGFAHGFMVLSSEALFHYKCADVYRPEDEGGLLWSDTQIGIQWPPAEPILSDKDRRWPPLARLSHEHLPRVAERSGT